MQPIRDYDSFELTKDSFLVLRHERKIGEQTIFGMHTKSQCREGSIEFKRQDSCKGCLKIELQAKSCMVVLLLALSFSSAGLFMPESVIQ
jgi:hypothetical protein